MLRLTPEHLRRGAIKLGSEQFEQQTTCRRLRLRDPFWENAVPRARLLHQDLFALSSNP